MLNYNWNTLYTKPNVIAPVLANTFDYVILGGGGGGNAGNGGQGGNGGAGGQLVSGSFSFNHLSTATLNVGNGGAGGAPIGGLGVNGSPSTLVYNAVTYTANGGARGANATANRGGKTSPYSIKPNSTLYTWGQDGTKGGDSPVGTAGIGGGTGGQDFPWGTSSSTLLQNAFTNSGGGGGGFRWDEFNGGGNINGAKGMCMLRFFDPRDVFDYTGTWDVFVYQDGYKYFYYQNNGTFTFLGKRD